MTAAPKTILSVAYPFAAVGPSVVGGAEQVLATVEAALANHGFRSVVAGHAGSIVRGTLFGVPVPDGVLTSAVRSEVELGLQHAIDRAFLAGPIDLVHMHGIDFHRYILPRHIPVLVTLHLPPSWYPSAIWDLPANVHLQCVSQSQRSACPERCLGRLLVAGNGVPLPPPAAGRRRRGRYALMLSRICPEKNLHLGLDAARSAGVPVLLAGEVYPYPEHLLYFEQQIRPRLGIGARFIGPVGGHAKQRLLSRARCLLVPSLAEETSSLVAMEALAAGTPVVALPSGALPEIIEDGRTGFLVRDLHAMAAAIRRTAEIQPELCRSAAQERFSSALMITRYLDIYQQLLG